jgi:uncharacterized protein YndB with AHSA1/START domain
MTTATKDKINTEPIVKEVELNVPVGIVWQAITDRDKMKNWYFEINKFKPEVGFEFQFYGETEQKRYLHKCKITEVTPGKKLSYSWKYEGYPGKSLVTFDLIPEGNLPAGRQDKTKLRLTHKGLENFPHDNPDLARQNFVEGWDQLIGKSLKEYVENNKSLPTDNEVIQSY